MKVYTRTGDSGETSLRHRARVPKSDPRIEAIGDIDELNAFIGLLRSHLDHAAYPYLSNHLLRIQENLFEMGAELADGQGSRRIRESWVEELEEAIDRLEGSLPPLRHFILPGGHPIAGLCHVARTVARRAERRLVHVAREARVNPASLAYLNRLSDFLFVAARHVNAREGVSDIPWPGDRR